MPVKSTKQYGLMQAAMHGSITGNAGPTRAVAKEFIEKTPKKKRKMFAKAMMSHKGK